MDAVGAGGRGPLLLASLASLLEEGGVAKVVHGSEQVRPGEAAPLTMVPRSAAALLVADQPCNRALPGPWAAASRWVGDAQHLAPDTTACMIPALCVLCGPPLPLTVVCVWWGVRVCGWRVCGWRVCLQVVPWLEQACGGAISPMLDTRVLSEMLLPLDLAAAAGVVRCGTVRCGVYRRMFI